MTDLESPGVTERISAKLLHEINSYAITTYYEPHRWHLGASLIGHDCARYLWYTFRWCGREVGEGRNDEERTNNLGRKQRLLNRGHREEDRFIEFLNGIGCEVWSFDPNSPLDETGSHSQYRMSAINGHFGGSLDAIIRLPERYNIDIPLLGEFKTNGTGRGFNDLANLSVQVTKPQHYIQMSCYGEEYKLTHAAYFNVNKNDDDLYVSVVKLNWNLAQQMKAKAERIIYSTEPPPRISETPTYFKCVYCPFKGPCHESKPVEKNCRSCVNASPVENGEWFCNFHNGRIPRDFVPQGCPSYRALVNA